MLPEPLASVVRTPKAYPDPPAVGRAVTRYSLQESRPLAPIMYLNPTALRHQKLTQPEALPPAPVGASGSVTMTTWSIWGSAPNQLTGKHFSTPGIKSGQLTPAGLTCP